MNNLDRQGSREEIQNFLALRDWFAADIEGSEHHLQACAGSIRTVQSELDTWTSAARRLTLQLDAKEPGLDELREALHGVEGSVSWSSLQRADSECAVLIPPASLPPPPALGESLGPLKFAAWLLNAGSLSLTLLVGMMGFGLLGATISTFVKERAVSSANSEDSPVVVSDLAGVVLRGLSAAVVVFLAVQGGLAVLAGGSGDPNPYVLLLACLVAAVFSERVWDSASTYFTERLSALSKADQRPDAADGPAAPVADELSPPAFTTHAGEAIKE